MSINDSQQKISVKETLFQYFWAVNFVLFWESPISSLNLSSEVLWKIFVSFSRKKYSISMNYQDLITAGNEQLQAMA